MSHRCYNMTWVPEYHQIGRGYLGLAIPALVFHVLFWVQVATHRALRQMSMLWVYNYLLTDFLLLVQLFAEYTLRVTLPYCLSRSTFFILCNIEAYTTAYMTILEAYLLVCLNITRYYLIVKNNDISARYPYFLLLVNILVYMVGIGIVLFQVELVHTVLLHPHEQSQSCHFQYHKVRTQVGNLIIVFLLPVISNFYLMALTAIHVMRSKRAVRTQRSKHIHLLLQLFVLYILWLVLWAPNVVVSYFIWSNSTGAYTRFGSITSALCDPLIFMFIDRRFLKVWRVTFSWIIRWGRPPRQIQPTGVSNEIRIWTIPK